MLNYHAIEESYRYLGLIVNHMLIFDHHVDDIKKKEKGTIIDAMGLLLPIIYTSRSTRPTDVLWVVPIWSCPTASCVNFQYRDVAMGGQQGHDPQ